MKINTQFLGNILLIQLLELSVIVKKCIRLSCKDSSTNAMLAEEFFS